MSEKLLYISGNGFPSSESDGRGAFSLEHAGAIIAEGLTVQAVDTQASEFSDDVQQGVPIDRFPRIRTMLKRFDIKGLSRYISYFWKVRKSGDYDYVIFSFFYLKYIPLLLLLRQSDVRILVMPHGGDVMPGGWIRARLKRVIFNIADVITPNSDFTETLLSCLVNRKDRDNRKIVTIPCGVNWQKLKPTIERSAFREQIGIPNDHFVILSICNLIRRKGIDILIKAIGELLAEGKSISHVIIGRGPEREALEKLAADTGQPERFTFFDRVTNAEMANYYAMADIFSMISITGWDANQVEGFGITYAEAMALGIPVIGGAGSGTTTPIKHGFNGLLVAPHGHKPHKQVRAAIDKYMVDREFYERTAQNAEWYAKEHFDWQRNAKRTIAALQAS